MRQPPLPWPTTSIRARLLCSTTLAVILILTWTGFAALKNNSEVTGRTEAVGNAATAESLNIITATEPRDQNITWNTFAEVTDAWDKTVTPTSFGPIVLVDAPHSESSSQTTEPKTSVVSLNPEDGSIRWIRTLFPGADSFSIQGIPRGPHPRNAPFSALYDSSSPDGRHISIRLESLGNKQSIVVLSAESGEVVRTVAVDDSKNILGQALTNGELVVETSHTAYPQDATVTSYPLSDPTAKPSSWQTSQWLSGGVDGGVILSPYQTPEVTAGSTTFTATVTVVDPVSGSTLHTINNVYRLNPSGWAERYTDPSSASLEMGAPEWYESSRELVHLSDRTSVDITGYRPLEATTPSGRSWALYHQSGARPRTDQAAHWPCPPGSRRAQSQA